MQLPRLAIVDLETTGADPQRDRITEVAILITEGDQLIEQWSTLVNPGMSIPRRIQDIIGITDEMVASAPSFDDIASEVRAKLSGALFVAHNVRFDYNFLRAAFERRNEHFDSPVLCSVKLSRALNPEHPRHGLDAIIARHGYAIESRHRALDDASIVWRFITDCLKAHTPENIQRAWSHAFSAANVPRLPTGDLEALPDSPGVYVFYGATGQVLHVGRAQDLRSQVLGIFTGARNDNKTKRLAAQVRNVDVHPAAGELGAQLHELRLTRQIAQADAKSGAAAHLTPAFAWHWKRDALRPPVLILEELTGRDPASWGDMYGCLRGEREAQTALRALAKQHRLCHTRIGLEQGVGACQALHLGRCNGVCIGKEGETLHDLRLANALAALRIKAWPYTGVVSIREYHPSTERSELQIFNQWCHLGSAQSVEEAHDLLSQARVFDADIYRLLHRWLSAPGHTELGVVLTNPPDVVSL